MKRTALACIALICTLVLTSIVINPIVIKRHLFMRPKLQERLCYI